MDLFNAISKISILGYGGPLDIILRVISVYYGW